ncbi:MAG: HlyD family secretion protein [Firmicutes bacterium]|nr:HlyD family secretion protein [Bacillota bacterium]
MKFNKKYILLIMIPLIIGLLSGCDTIKASTEDENVFKSDEGLVSRGIIEVKEVSINTKIPGKIDTLHIKEGESVKAGDLLVEIGSEELEAKKEQALGLIKASKASYEASKGQVNSANAMLSKAKNGARKQSIAQAETYYNLMKKTYERVNKLYEKGAVSEQKKDEVKAKLDIAKQKLSMAKEGARSEDINAAQALVTQALSMKQAAKGKLDQAKAGLEEVNAYIEDTKIVSPIDGTITSLNVDEGELVSTGMTLSTVSNLDKPWVEVKVDETNLKNISLGDKVNIKIPTYSDKTFKGKVVRINKKPDFATKRATNDNGNFDIITFGVKVEIDNNEKVLRPGMTAFVQFK